MRLLSTLLPQIFILYSFTYNEHITASEHDYCIVGAGPAGLQLSYFLHQAKRDFVVFERNNISGSFFLKYPRHRKLISINKRFTGRINAEFNMRHDWNSLISNDSRMLMKHFSQDYFPTAQQLLSYLSEFQRVFNFPIKFNTEITDIRRSTRENCRFEMTGGGETCCCRKALIVANGLALVKRSRVHGNELFESYDEMPITPENFSNQRVLILGAGNSAFETAAALYGTAAYVTLATRASRLRFSWDTHYVGDIRAVNNEMLDAYQLKSLDGLLTSFDIENAQFYRARDGRIHIAVPNDTVLVDEYDNNPVRSGFDRVLQCIGFDWDSALFSKGIKITRSGRKLDKYPSIDWTYQSIDYDHLYFAGTIAHSLDWRKSAGGFIHGFRYTVQALHRVLEWRYENCHWPSSRPIPIDQLANYFLKRVNEASSIYQMFSHIGDIAIFNRNTRRFRYVENVPLNVIPSLKNSTGIEIDFNSELLFTLSLEYGSNFSVPGADHFGADRLQASHLTAEKSNFLHPVFRVFDNALDSGGDRRETPFYRLHPIGILHLLEDFTTEYSAFHAHVTKLTHWIEFFAERNLRKLKNAQTCLQTLLFTHALDPYSRTGNHHFNEYCSHVARMDETINFFA